MTISPYSPLPLSHEIITHEETSVELPLPKCLRNADIQDLVIPIFEELAMKQIGYRYFSATLIVQIILGAGCISSIIVPLATDHNLRNEPVKVLPIIIGSFLVTTVLMCLSSAMIYRGLMPFHASKIAQNQFETAFNEPVPDDILYRIFYRLTNEQIALLNTKQFSTLIHRHWSAIDQKFQQGALTATQSYVVSRISILRNFNEQTLTNLFSSAQLIQDLKICPIFKEVFFDLINPFERDPMTGSRFRSQLNILKEQLAPVEPSNELNDTDLDHIGTDGSVDEESQDLYTRCSSSSSSSSSSIPSAPEVDEQYDKILFKDDEFIENLPKHKLKKSCKYFNSIFLESATQINLKGIPKDEFELFLLALECPNDTIDNANINTILNIASYLFADDIIVYCMKYIADHINDINLHTFRKLTKTASTQDSTLNDVKAQIQIDFTDQIFNTNNTKLLLNKIEQFYSIFSIPDCYILLQACISSRLKYILSFPIDMAPDNVNRYQEIIESLPQVLADTHKSAFDNILKISLKTSIIEFWDYASAHNRPQLKNAIINFCLSDNGKRALQRLKLDKGWYELPSEFGGLPQT